MESHGGLKLSYRFGQHTRVTRRQCAVIAVVQMCTHSCSISNHLVLPPCSTNCLKTMAPTLLTLKILREGHTRHVLLIQITFILLILETTTFQAMAGKPFPLQRILPQILHCTLQSMDLLYMLCTRLKMLQAIALFSM